MACVFIALVAGVLAWFELITPATYLFIAFGSLVLVHIETGLYFKYGFLKFFYHDLLEWHVPEEGTRYSDGYMEHAICKHCKKDIIQDSQGNWFR